MSIKNPLLFRSLTRADTFFGMHLLASLGTLFVSFIFGLATELMWGLLMGFVGLMWIRRLTRQDPFFLEVFGIRLLELKKTKRLRPKARENRYAV